MQPFISRQRDAEWYRGTADAVLQNIDLLRESDADTVVILAGDHIYKMDYQPFVQQHRRKRADVTIAVKRVPIGEAHRFGILALDDNDEVVEWQEKPRQPRSDLASLGIYVFSKKALLNWMAEDRTDFGAHVVPAMIEGGARVFGYHFDGYWQDVGTIDSYWRAHMELLEDHPALDLYDRDWVIHTRSEERAPGRIGATANVHRSLISHGCQIAGTVDRSVLSPGVRVDPGAIVRDSVIMFDAVIRAGAVVDRAIIDKEVSVGPNAIVGMGSDYDTPNRLEPSRLNTGITVIGKRAVIPAGMRLGRNVRVDEGVHASDFGRSKTVASGGNGEPQGQRRARARRCRRWQDQRCRGIKGTHEPAARRRVDRDGTAGRLSTSPTDVDGWLAELSLSPIERHERESVVSWDLIVDGRSRRDIRLTLILEPSVGIVGWLHYAPPLSDSFRKSYRQFLRWNDELPFVKFALSEDERPVLSAEVPVGSIDEHALGLMLARLVAVCDLLLAESVRWLWPGAKAPPHAEGEGRNPKLLERYAAELAELAATELSAAGPGPVPPVEASTT